MARIEKSIEIKVPSEKVWQMLALDRWPEWMEEEWKNAEYTSEVRKLEDKYRVGAFAHIYDSNTKYDFEITESLESEKITFRTKGTGGGRVTMTITYILEPAEKATKLTYAMDYEMPWGILGKGLDKLGHRSGEKTVEKELETLKSILEKRIPDQLKKREGHFMILEDNKAVIRRWFEAENKKDLSPIEEIVAPDFFDHTHQLRGIEEYKQRLNMFIKAFPDFHETIEDIIAEGDKVWVSFKFSGTHTGEYLGLAPTGKNITVECVNIFRIVDGKAVEEWEIADALDMLKQLGVIKYTRKGKKLFLEDV